jgi:hypothetical protein
VVTTLAPALTPPRVGSGSVRLPGRPRLVAAPPVTNVPASQYAFLGLTARVADRLLRAGVDCGDPVRLAAAIDDAVLDVTTTLTDRTRAITETTDRDDRPPRAEVVRAHGAAARYLRMWRPSAGLGLGYAGPVVAAETRELSLI